MGTKVPKWGPTWEQCNTSTDSLSHDGIIMVFILLHQHSDYILCNMWLGYLHGAGYMDGFRSCQICIMGLGQFTIWMFSFNIKHMMQKSLGEIDNFIKDDRHSYTYELLAIDNNIWFSLKQYQTRFPTCNGTAYMTLVAIEWFCTTEMHKTNRMELEKWTVVPWIRSVFSIMLEHLIVIILWYPYCLQ